LSRIVLVLLLVVVVIPAARGAGGVPDFDHVVVVIFENKEEAQVIGAGTAPTFTSLARHYAQLTRY
jgi:hypothetical protein